MKITSSDLLAILRRFGEAGDEHVPRHIDQIRQSHPSPINQLVQFRFNHHHYFVLIDDSVEDRASYIMQQVHTAKSDAVGEILTNPTSDLTTYGLPFKGKDVYVFRVISDKKRLDVLLAERFPDKSRSTWQKLIKRGAVHIDGQPIVLPKHEVTEAMPIQITLPADVDHSDRELPVIYLDDHVIVINKPVGILTHAKGALADEFTVADFVRRYTTVGLDTNRPGIVHRLDRDTSGVLIAARTPEAFALLKSQFSDRKAKKTYVAILNGIPTTPHAIIEAPIGRDPRQPSTFRVDPKGKSATTEYRVVAQHDKHCLVILKPQTGRTHQLRVHMAYINCPIFGDRVYGTASDRLYLHAHTLEVTLPDSQRHIFEVPIPQEFVGIFPEVNRGQFV